MRILVNALSVTNLSGRHVLLGHLRRLAKWTAGKHEFVVLHHDSNRDLVRDLGKNVLWMECPNRTAEWKARGAWELCQLPKIVRWTNSDAVFNPAGTVFVGLDVPQISFAQNPWCLADIPRKGWTNRFKARLQQIAYRHAMKKASVMVFNSRYMRNAYRKNAGCKESRSYVIYQGVDDDTFQAARAMRRSIKRRRGQVVSVSAMAPHKGVETVVEAIRIVRTDFGFPASLALVGGWPDVEYERAIRFQVAMAGLEDAVEFRGHVRRRDLYCSYAESKVFCLMSRCESFGIPAVEAQAFGTPVITSNCCAMPEIGGAGGVYPLPGDAREVAAQMFRLLSDDDAWTELSELALANARRFRWDRCSMPFLNVFDDLELCLR